MHPPEMYYINMEACKSKLGNILVVLLLSSNLIFTVTAKTHLRTPPESSDSVEISESSPKPDVAVPLHYNIMLELDENLDDPEPSINGESHIDIQVLVKTKFIFLNYHGLIKRATIRNDTVVWNAQIFFLNDLYFRRQLSPGRYKLRLQHESHRTSISFFKSPYMKLGILNLWLMYSVFQPQGARQLFPCWEEANIKATFTIFIKHSESYMPVSNAEIHNMQLLTDLKYWTDFKSTPAIPVYHLAIALVPTEFSMYFVPGMNTIIQHRPFVSNEFELLCDMSKNVALRLHLYTNFNLALRPRFLILPGIYHEAIANWDLIVFRESSVAYDPVIDPIGNKLEAMYLITRTIMNLWLHNVVSPSRLLYLWVNEALAIFLQNLNQSPFGATLFKLQFRHESLHMDHHDIMESIETSASLTMHAMPHMLSDPFLEIPSLSYYSIFVKAPVIFSVLEHILTPQVFRHGIDQYVHTHAFKNATPDDLWDVMQNAQNKATLNGNVNQPDIRSVMRTWIQQRNYPTVTVKRHKNNNKIVVSHNFKKIRQYWIPITYTSRKISDFQNTMPSSWLTPSVSRIILDPIDKNDWIIVNIQQAGYYRVYYEPWNWQLLINKLNSENFTDIHVLNRAQLIDDAYYFMMKHKLNYNVFLKLTRFLSRETEYIAWYPMFKIFNYMSVFLPYEEGNFLKDHMKLILEPLIHKIKFETNSYNEDISVTILRDEALRWACLLDNRNCVTTAIAKTIRLIVNDFETYRIPSIWGKWKYCNNMHSESSSTKLKIWKEWLEINLPLEQISDRLCCFKKPDDISMIFSFIMENNKMRNNDRINMFFSFIAKHAQDNLDVILQHFENYGFRYNEIKTFSILINHIYSAEKLHKISTFVYKKFDQTARNFSSTKRDMFVMINARWSRIRQIIKKMSYLFQLFETTSDRIIKSQFVSSGISTISKDIMPLHYDIELEILQHFPPHKIVIDCKLIVKIMIQRATRVIQMHYRDYRLSSHIYMTLLDNATKTYTASSYTLDNNIFSMNFENPLSPGTYILSMGLKKSVYELTKSFFRTAYIDEDGNEIWLGGTDFKPTAAAHIIPCWIEPGMKSTFNISVYHHRSYKALSNMPVESTTEVDERHIISRFFTTPLIPINSLAIAIVPPHFYHFYSDPDSGEETHLWCRSHFRPYAKYMSHVAYTATIYFNYLTGFKNLPKTDLVVVRGLSTDTIESLGLITFNEAAIAYDENIHPAGRKLQITPLITRTVASQWFLDLVGTSEWSELWLPMGLSIFFGNQAFNEFAKNARLTRMFLVMLQHESLHLDVDNCLKPLSQKHITKPYDITPLMSFSLYVKAPAVIRMLQYISGTIFEFLTTIQQYFKLHQAQKITFNNLFETIEGMDYYTLRNGNNRYPISSLKTIMNSWISNTNYPVLNVTRNYKNNSVVILQENLNMYNQTQWWIPISFTTQNERNSHNIGHKGIIWLTPNVPNLILKEVAQYDEWFIANIKFAGYYRVNYDRRNWKLIARCLNSENYSQIDILNRVQIIDDAYHLLTLQKLDYDIFVDLTTYLSKETDYTVWYPMLKIFEYLSPYLVFRESIVLKDHMMKIVNGALSIITYTQPENEDYLTTCLRQELARWACILDDVHCKKLANNWLVKYLISPLRNKLLPGWKGWVFCNGLNVANEDTWLNFWHIYNKHSIDTISRIVLCSGSFANPNFQFNKQILWNNKNLEQFECVNLVHFVAAMLEVEALNNTLANLADRLFYCGVSSKDIMKMLFVVINHIYNERHLFKVKKFTQKNSQLFKARHLLKISHSLRARRKRLISYKTEFAKLIQKRN